MPITGDEGGRGKCGGGDEKYNEGRTIGSKRSALRTKELLDVLFSVVCIMGILITRSGRGGGEETWNGKEGKFDIVFHCY